MKRRFAEWFSIQRAKNPGRLVLLAILLFNIVLWTVSALLISNLALNGTEKMGFFEAAYYTITMILDAGCIQFVIEDIGKSGVSIAIICMVIIIVGMISFTGAVIGYVTNYISNFIDNSNEGNHKLRLSGHLVILNWNTRASEIVNDLLYCKDRQKIVILVDDKKDEIKREVTERIADTITRENAQLKASCSELGFLKRGYVYQKKRLKNNITLIVREGDVFSSKQLKDISLERARSVVILGSDINNSICWLESKERMEEMSKGNAQTIKTLMQVADITSAEFSEDNQKIIVEIADDWTWNLVDRIIHYKVSEDKSRKCNIVPVRVNKVLGQILSQFSLMPELNYAYRELFSNKGATFCVEELSVDDNIKYISNYLNTHPYAIPLTSLTSKGKEYFYYVAEEQEDIKVESHVEDTGYQVRLNRDYWISKKNVIILGHNSNCEYIMEGFVSFVNEWQYENKNESILQIIVIDEGKNLEKMSYYEKYPFVVKTVEASIYDRELICNTIEEFVEANDEDTSILILSDDTALNDDIDSNALANLVYVQDIISKRKAKDEKFDIESIDIIVEIIDPKHHDVINSYNINNVVISNRYISKMITQIGEREAIFDFYTDILSYDGKITSLYESKEIYAKKVSGFFDVIPAECTASELIRAVWYASVDPALPDEKVYPTMVLGYVKPGGKVTLFGKESMNDRVNLEEHDKIIVFSNH